jgi:hypothetical protein
VVRYVVIAILLMKELKIRNIWNPSSLLFVRARMKAHIFFSPECSLLIRSEKIFLLEAFR